MDNLTVITNLANGLSPEKAKKAESFNCPVCGTEIPSGQGINKCPNVPACGITREEYAKRENVVRCD